jgi:hypothetical protein
MRNILCGFILGIVFLPLATAWAQPDTLWSSRLDLTGASALYNATSVTDGYVAVGYGVDPNGDADMLIAKFSLTGEIVWTRLLGTGRHDEAWGVVQTANGNLFVAGFGVDASNSRNTVLLAGLSSTGDSLWWRGYAPATGQSKARDAILLDDGNVAVIGYRVGANGSTSDMWLFKCAPNGDTLWTHMYGGAQNDAGYRLCQRPDGGLAMVGTTGSMGGGGDDPWLVLTNSAGGAPIQRAFGMVGQQYGSACAVTENNEIFVGGRGSANSGPAFIAKCTATGDTLWRNYYSEAATSQVRGLQPELDGGALCVGADLSGGAHAWLMGVGMDGNVGWTWTMSLTPSELWGIIPTVPRGGLAFGSAGGDGYLLRLGPPSGIAGTAHEVVSGAPVPNVHVTTVGSTFAAITDALGHYGLVRSPGIYTLTAFGPCVESDTFGTVTTYADSVVQVDLIIGVPDYEQTQTSLNITAQNHIPSECPLYLRNRGSGVMSFEVETETISPPTDWLSVNPAAGFVAAGESLAVGVIVTIDTTDDGAFDIFGYLHLRTNSCPDSTDELPVLVTVLGAHDPLHLPPLSFSLSAYPNPFNPQSTISFSVPRESEVRLEVFNVAGQRVRVLLHERITPGIHRVEFTAPDLPSGLYFARLTCDKFAASQKLLLLK